MINPERLVRTIIISNEKRIDVFRIHVFENSIKFDPRFAYGISQNIEIYNMIMYIEDLWRSRKIELSNIFNMMLDILEKHEKYLEKFYLRPEELDNFGRVYDLAPYSSTDEAKYTYYMCLNNKHRLKQISRAEFEKNMKNADIANTYIENYSGKNIQFFNYRTTGLRNPGKDCYFMIIEDSLRVGFVKSE